ncbi:hypothetical protein AC249_AIPGENE20086 [Exaiptasia diaphana]|nr:hypothetical protein AC249_AIPGENE20086 [Exaiptasia diaphana]
MSRVRTREANGTGMQEASLLFIPDTSKQLEMTTLNGSGLCSKCLESEMNLQGFNSPFKFSSPRRRRHSSSDSELLSERLTKSEKETANTDAIEKFLSVCLQQFESYSRSKNHNGGHNLGVQLKVSVMDGFS